MSKLQGRKHHLTAKQARVVEVIMDSGARPKVRKTDHLRQLLGFMEVSESALSSFVSSYELTVLRDKYKNPIYSSLVIAFHVIGILYHFYGCYVSEEQRAAFLETAGNHMVNYLIRALYAERTDRENTDHSAGFRQYLQYSLKMSLKKAVEYDYTYLLGRVWNVYRISVVYSTKAPARGVQGYIDENPAHQLVFGHETKHFKCSIGVIQSFLKQHQARHIPRGRLNSTYNAAIVNLSYRAEGCSYVVLSTPILIMSILCGLAAVAALASWFLYSKNVAATITAFAVVIFIVFAAMLPPLFKAATKKAARHAQAQLEKIKQEISQVLALSCIPYVQVIPVVTDQPGGGGNAADISPVSYRVVTGFCFRNVSEASAPMRVKQKTRGVADFAVAEMVEPVGAVEELTLPAGYYLAANDSHAIICIDADQVARVGKGTHIETLLAPFLTRCERLEVHERDKTEIKRHGRQSLTHKVRPVAKRVTQARLLASRGIFAVNGREFCLYTVKAVVQHHI